VNESYELTEPSPLWHRGTRTRLSRRVGWARPPRRARCVRGMTWPWAGGQVNVFGITLASTLLPCRPRFLAPYVGRTRRLSILARGCGRLVTVREVVGPQDCAAADLHLASQPIAPLPGFPTAIHLRRNLLVPRDERLPRLTRPTTTSVDPGRSVGISARVADRAAALTVDVSRSAAAGAGPCGAGGGRREPRTTTYGAPVRLGRCPTRPASS
jgi:hypothetical protein